MLLFALAALIGAAMASSHSEAPGSAKGPRVSDFTTLDRTQTLLTPITLVNEKKI